MVKKRSNPWRARSANWAIHAVSRLSGGRQYQIANLVSRIRMRRRTVPEKTYETILPDGFGARRAIVRLSVPKMPSDRIHSFSEHANSENAGLADTVIACTLGGIAISEDLGLSWKSVRLRPFAKFPILRSRLLPNGEILLVALDPHGHRPWADANNRFIVADMHGTVLHTAKMPGAAWHGPRAVDASGGTLMYAEYPWNDPRQGSDSAAHKTSRVWRSRDFGRSWRQVFEQGAVRHFHYLQARPGVTGEWWLTSGDEPEESRIWRSTDDGDTWIDQTGTFGPFITIGNYRFSRSLFRLTDLAWAGDEIIWGSDDVLNATVETTGSSKPARSRGSRVFCANPSTGMAPTVVGNCGPEVRSIVDVGKFYVLATQSSRGFADDKPQVLLLSKPTAGCAPGLVHLFDVERHTDKRTGFTHSLASRRADNGVFFTYRKSTDVFRAPDRILRWQIEFE